LAIFLNSLIEKQKKLEDMNTEIQEKTKVLADLKNDIQSRQKLLETLNSIVFLEQ